MRLLFITDLHGDARKYDKVCKTAQQHNVDIVLNGGDMLPHNGTLFHQDRFITGYLHKHFQCFEEARIYYLCFLGNDDLKIFDPLFEETCRQYYYVHNLAQRRVAIHDREFIGMNWIVDTPFRLKDRCRKDTPDFIFPAQVAKALISTEQGWQELDNWLEYAETLPTISDELDMLPRPLNIQQSVYMIHMPPAHLGLDVCRDGRQVGSKAIYQFLHEHQPGYALHGHIHESPEVSGIWRASLGNTTCIQPGQMARFTYVIIDLAVNTIERHVEQVR
ncbi:metallophosphoesterase [candidate division KSB1 bacterium]|nr:metallophosphoesterase [candidate division KSB1 bacterium]RQW10759.1 MAG: phosphoesterase [candidate division KSB1 bacterium]